MSLNWKDFFYNSDRVTNVKIVCKDGVVFTHKIIVASINNFFKEVISIIPTGDEAILIMPNHEQLEVQNFLKMGGPLNGDNPSRRAKDEKARPIQIKSEEIDHLFDSDIESISDGLTYKHLEKDDNDVDAKLGESLINEDWVHQLVGWNVDDEEAKNSESVFKEEIVTKDQGSVAIDFVNSMDENEKQEYQESIRKYLIELEKRERMIIRPCTAKDSKLLFYTETQIQYEKAKLDILTGKFQTYAT